jgi:hypothetical protein
MAVPAPARSSFESRSYRWPHAVVATHAQALGVDIERVEPMGRDFAESICTPRERAQLGPLLHDDLLVASLWSGKEALAKALGDAVDYDPRRLEAPLAWPDGRSGRWRAKQIQVPSGHVGWLVWAGEPEPSYEVTTQTGHHRG